MDLRPLGRALASWLRTAGTAGEAARLRRRFRGSYCWWCSPRRVPRCQTVGAITRDLRIFVSYDYDRDRAYRHLLSAWSANRRFSFSFEDHSTPKINSEQAARIKAAITAKMKAADCLLVIVGRDTHRSHWVTWEIEKAKELGLALVAVKVKRAHRTPPALIGAGAKWAYSFTEAAVAKAVAAANS